ncbi:Gfo/Idh/MocA family protein [Paenibacillus sp. OSY-SE]|uniref:Gfo/Idh/MocA family protein n=1 Tax=Paenibacillus sp. OSY-SE TaxID=1196323 RepID=UPI00031585C8|nr:Gfo/Idh/MocA family oxidoreductase [Paenibacillus sp. OSY-SE]
MTSRKIRLAIIGLGNMGQHMIRLVNKPEFQPEIELTAICESNDHSRQQCLEKYPELKYYADYQLLLDNTDIDLLYVAVPPAFHHDVVSAALRKNIHVFCEKPLANSLEEAKRLLLMAREAGVVHAIHFSMPHEPAVRQMKKMVAEEAIGAIRKIDLILQFPKWPRDWQHNSWISSRQQGGFVLEVGVHWIHVMQKLFGRITHVQSELEFSEQPDRCEIGVRAKMLIADGVPVQLNGMSEFAGEERVSLVVYGTTGTIALENWSELFAGSIGQPLQPVAADDELGEPPVLKHVIQAIRGEQADLYDFHDGYDAQVVLEALRHPESSQLVDIREHDIHI